MLDLAFWLAHKLAINPKELRMICRNKIASLTGCISPLACAGWGYCRERNIKAGGMKNVTPEMQAEWKKLDNPA